MATYDEQVSKLKSLVELLVKYDRELEDLKEEWKDEEIPKETREKMVELYGKCREISLIIIQIKTQIREASKDQSTPVGRFIDAISSCYCDTVDDE